MTTIRIWRPAYRAFMMGGNVHTPICADVEALGPYDLGKGFQGYVVTDTYKGCSRVVCAESLGVIGDTLESVRADVGRCKDVAFMRKQVAEAKIEGETATVMDAEAFWRPVH